MNFIEKTLKVCHFPGITAIPQGIVGISFLQQGIAVAIIDCLADGKLLLRHCAMIETDAASLAEQLQILRKHFQLKRHVCHVVLTTGNYQLVNVEAPAVADQEMSQALRWKLYDLLDFPADQAIIDWFHLPAAKNTQNRETLSVIATEEQSVKTYSQACRKAGLNLNVIDIQEMVLRNLALLLPENERGVALLHLQQTDGNLVIIKDGEIYLSRLLDIGHRQLSCHDEPALYPSPGEESRASIHFSNLVLEIQRSLDYVESYYALPPISGIVIIPIPENTQALLDQLNSQLSITARILDIPALVNCDMALNDELQALCAPAIGAALRSSHSE